MRQKHLAPVMIVSLSIFAVGTLAAQDRFSLKSPNGISFSEFKDYETWHVIAASTPDGADGCGTSPAPGCIKAIVGNPTMIQAYKDGIPASGKPVPDGAMMAKIEWQKARDPASAYGAIVPGALAEIAFMMKELETIPGDGRMGVRHVQARSILGRVEAVWRQSGVREHLSRVSYAREVSRFCLHEIPETLSASGFRDRCVRPCGTFAFTLADPL